MGSCFAACGRNELSVWLLNEISLRFRREASAFFLTESVGFEAGFFGSGF